VIYVRVHSIEQKAVGMTVGYPAAIASPKRTRRKWPPSAIVLLRRVERAQNAPFICTATTRAPSTERRKTSIESLRRESADDVERGAAVADAAASPR
jgi:hypothetical protein